MLAGSWRVLAPGGLFFCRLASSIGFEPRGLNGSAGAGRRYRLPDGSVAVSGGRVVPRGAERNVSAGVLLDPIKTTVVQDQRGDDHVGRAQATPALAR